MKSKAILGLFAFATVAAIFLIQTSPALATQGNQGTLQIHKKGSSSADPSNEPKVCVFNFEGFGLNPHQSGDVTIETQGGGPNTIVVGSVHLKTDGNGNGHTDYINDLGSTVIIPNGHYKATLDNKFGTDNGNKAKSKVFKVECADSIKKDASASVEVMPATCELGEVLKYGGINNATFSGTANGTVGPASYEVIATADEGALFDGEQTKLIFSGTLAGKIPVQTTDPQAKCFLGMGSQVPEDDDEDEAEDTAVSPVGTDVKPTVRIAELPYTAGSTTPLFLAGAFALVVVFMAVSTAVKSRLLAS